jgi:signal transduction histidine kinase
MRALHIERERLTDLGLTAFVLAFTFAQFASTGFGDFDARATDPDALGAVLVALAALPLLARRARPWLVLATTLVASLALAALGYGVHVQMAPAVALYSLAARTERSDPRLMLAIVVPAFAVLTALESANLGTAPPDWLGEAVLWLSGWLVGERQRLARQRAGDLRERHEREQRLAVADERTRIARELHDTAGHAINTIRIQAGAARMLRERDPKGSADAIVAIEEVAAETLEDIDRIVGALRDDAAAPLTPMPGVDDIGALVDRHRAAGLDFDLRVTGAKTIPPAVGRAGYRIAQEALTNAARHGAGSAVVLVEHGTESLELTVTNPMRNGCDGRQGGGLGIVGMRERASLLGGSIDTGAEGATFRVRAVLPYEAR